MFVSKIYHVIDNNLNILIENHFSNFWSVLMMKTYILELASALMGFFALQIKVTKWTMGKKLMSVIDTKIHCLSKI
jgi:hypothetical protein